MGYKAIVVDNGIVRSASSNDLVAICNTTLR